MFNRLPSIALEMNLTAIFYICTTNMISGSSSRPQSAMSLASNADSLLLRSSSRLLKLPPDERQRAKGTATSNSTITSTVTSQTSVNSHGGIGGMTYTSHGGMNYTSHGGASQYTSTSHYPSTSQLAQLEHRLAQVKSELERLLLKDLQEYSDAVVRIQSVLRSFLVSRLSGDLFSRCSVLVL